MATQLTNKTLYKHARRLRTAFSIIVFRNNTTMSNLSGFDGEAVGFEAAMYKECQETQSGTQTTEFNEAGVATQTNPSKEAGCVVTLEDLKIESDLKEYPSGLNEFLKRVVPSMMEHLGNNDSRDFLCNSSDSDEDEVVNAKLFQEIKLSDLQGMGDNSRCVLDVSWSSAGNSLAVSLGNNQHKNWCVDDGMIRIFTMKRAAGDTFVRSLDLAEASCVSKVKYHPSVAALLAYGTVSGEVVLCNLRNLDAILLTSPAGAHGSSRISHLAWADAALANTFLTMLIMNTGKRRGAADHILISGGCDGSINVWRVNVNQKIFENVVKYSINGSKNMDVVHISCFDFIKSYPLRPSDQKVPDDIFVVGARTGDLYLCKIKSVKSVANSKMVDPVNDVFQSHIGYVVDVAFSCHKPGIFVSASIDSELRVYDINQPSPLKVVALDVSISALAWLPSNPCVVILGLANPEKQQLLQVFNVNTGRPEPVEGLTGGGGCVTCITVNQGGVCRIAAGDSDNHLNIWELPTRRIKLTEEEF